MKPFSNIHEVVRKPVRPSLTADQRGSIIMAVILSVIYRHFLKAAVFGIVATQGARR